MPRGEGQNTSATETVNQAHTTTQIPLPGKFEEANSPQAADAWPKWLRQFDRYRVASGLNSKPQTKQVSTLLYAMGDSADDILQTLRLDEGTVSYEEIKKSLNDYFAEWRNIIVESSAHFNKRLQKPGESVDAFIQDLHRLADNCDYGTLKDDLIRDQIVVGVLDDTLSDRLQSKGTLTLAQAVEMSRQAESRAQNHDLVHGDSKPAQVEFVDPGKSGNKRTPNKESSKPNFVDGVAVKDTTAKYVLLKMLPVTNAKKGTLSNYLSQLCIANKENMWTGRRWRAGRGGWGSISWRSSNHRGWLDCPKYSF